MLLPDAEGARVVVPAPGPGPGSWSGAPSSAADLDGTVWLAHRTRTPATRGDGVVLGRSTDGEVFETVGRLGRERFGAASLERPALVRLDDGWRLYVSCATPGSRHWWVDALDAPTVEALPGAEAVTVWAGDDRTAVKDPVVTRDGDRWTAWVCCHPLDEPGHEDRMHSELHTSPDGLTWTATGTELRGRPGRWDARGARVTAVLPDGTLRYDGRATAAENFAERTGLARLGPGGATADGDTPLADVRYLDVLPLPDGRVRWYAEAPLPDGSHHLVTALA
ncbi:hypothetical protein [Angustibacter aerolatus]